MKILALTAFIITTLFSSSLLASQNLDVDGDGNADILWRNQTTGKNWLWTMNGVVVKESKGLNTIPLNWEIVGRGDFDGDGKSDIFWRNNDSGRNYIYLMDGFTIRTSQELNYLPNFDWKVKGITDLNGDGKDDVVWQHQTTGKTWIYLIDGVSITSSKGSNTVADLDWKIVATGDIDGDGNGDVIWRHSTSGENFIWLMNGTTIKNSYVLNTVPTSWDIVGSGDLNGDGTDDIVWRNASGVNWAYLMNGGQIDTSKQINSIANLQWQIRTIGDLNGDGKADIFWRNQSTGKTYAYLMDGTNILSAGYSSVISLNWQIISESTVSVASDDVIVDDCKNDSSTTCSLNLNSSTSGNIESSGDSDFYMITVPNNGSLTVFSSGSTDVNGAIYEVNNSTPLVEDSASGEGDNFSLTYSVSAGTYYVEVMGATGSYTLTSQYTEGQTVSPSEFYESDISAQIVQGKCVACHTSTGAAGASNLHFVKTDTNNYLSMNEEALINLTKSVGSDLILMKSIGSQGHGGGAQLTKGDDNYNALLEYLALID